MLRPFDREKLFSDATVATLATVDSKNRSHGMPIWYIYQDGIFLMSASRTTQMVRNTGRTGNASIIINRRETPYHAAMIRGRAEIGPTPDNDWLPKLAIRYMGEKRGNAYVSQGCDDDNVTLTLHPDDVSEYCGITGRD
jgi:PPOX class probable F420-dependent enzyme